MNEPEKKFNADLEERILKMESVGWTNAFKRGAVWAFQWFSRQSKLFELLSYSDRYQINFQMWPNQYTIYIDKDDVELWSYGSSDVASVVDKALEYLKRINRTT